MFARGRSAEIVHGDATELELEGSLDAILTSPPYPGLIDYHEQHRYAYEILGSGRSPRARAGCGSRGYEPPRHRELHGGHLSGPRPLLGATRGRSTGARRRQRPSRPLPGDPRAKRPPSRRAARAPRQSPNRATSGRVLRVDSRLCTRNVRDPTRLSGPADTRGSLARWSRERTRHEKALAPAVAGDGDCVSGAPRRPRRDERCSRHAARSKHRRHAAARERCGDEPEDPQQRDQLLEGRESLPASVRLRARPASGRAGGAAGSRGPTGRRCRAPPVRPA